MPHADLRGVTSHGSRWAKITENSEAFPGNGNGTVVAQEASSDILGSAVVIDWVRFHGSTDDLIVTDGAGADLMTIGNAGIGYEPVDAELGGIGVEAATSYGFKMSGTTDDADVGYRKITG